MMQHGDLRSAAFIESTAQNWRNFEDRSVFLAPDFNQHQFAA
jgi:hypothetical protein